MYHEDGYKDNWQHQASGEVPLVAANQSLMCCHLPDHRKADDHTEYMILLNNAFQLWLIMMKKTMDLYVLY